MPVKERKQLGTSDFVGYSIARKRTLNAHREGLENLWRARDRDVVNNPDTPVYFRLRSNKDFETFQECIRKITEMLCERYPDVVTTDGILGGMPRLNGTRLAVTDVLSEIVMQEGIDGVIEIFGEDVSHDQIKDAIRYARDFLFESLVKSK